MPDSKTKNNLENHKLHVSGVNLTEAIHLICHAGYPDPRISDENEGEGPLLQRVIDALCTLSMHDGLTGLSNLRYFKMVIKQELDRAARDGTTCSLLMIDIDHFKSVNDRYGHPAGDTALTTVAERLKEGLRPGDTIARYGGEEFSIVLPNCPLNYALHVAERLRLSVAEEEVFIDDQTRISVTVSIGVAESRASYPLDSDEIIKLADENLYKAKTAGRNQTWSEVPLTTVVSTAEKNALFKQEPQIIDKKEK